MTMLYKKKVYAYITREKEGVMQLLVFKHRDIHEAGIQVPGGTVDEGETLEAAILREVQEESGLRHLCIERFLADYIIHMKEKHSEGGEEIANCDICGKDMLKASLWLHKKTMHSDTVYTCPHCNYSSKRKDNLKQHLTKWCKFKSSF